MKKFIFFILSCIATQGICQIVISELPVRPNQINIVVSNDMAIIDRGLTIEIFSLVRATQESPNQFKVRITGASSVFSSDSLGVAFNHTLGTHLFLTGEISFKLPKGYPISLLSYIPTSKISAFGNSSVYICKGSTPEEVVRFFNYLQFNPAVEWVELFALNGLLN